MPSSLFHTPWYSARQRDRARRARCIHGVARQQRGPKEPCFVYLLIHERELRFKIGLSHSPRTRAEHLPDAPCIEQAASLQAKFPNAGRAREVERMLHKGLAGYRMRVEGPSGEPWDGGTEWFAMAGLVHAIALLRVTPLDGGWFDLAQLQTLDGQPYQDPMAPTLSGSPLRRQQAGECNLRRMAAISRVLETLATQLKLRWHGTGREPCLCIQGLKTAWQPELIWARFEVVASALWELQTGRADKRRATMPLVRLIRYSASEPGTLELVVNDLELIRKLPAGERVVRMWQSICKERP